MGVVAACTVEKGGQRDELQNSRSSSPLRSRHLRVVVLAVGLAAFPACRSGEVSSHRPKQLAWVTQAEQTVSPTVQALVKPHLKATERLIHSVSKTFPLSELTVYRVATFDAATGDARKLTVNSSGANVDFEALVSVEKARYRALHGVLDDGLHALLRRSTAGTEAVEIRYRPSGPAPVRPNSNTPLGQGSHASAIEALMVPNAARLSQEIVADGGRVFSRNRYVPIIEAELSPAVLLGKYKNHPLITAIVRSVKSDQVTHGAEISTVDLNLRPVLHYNGYYGSGVKVGITGEGEGDLHDPAARCGIHYASPWLVFSGEYEKSPSTACTTNSQCATICRSSGNSGVCAAGRCTIFHGTAVAGMVGHMYGAFGSRQAPSVRVYNANEPFEVTPHQEALAWLWNEGVHVTTKSWGGPVNIYAQDYYAIRGLTITELAGNAANGYRGEDVMAGCHAANTLCIAAYTTTTSFWDQTNTKNRDTCSKLYTGCDREEPHLTLHGGNATTTHWDPADADGLSTGSGTSLSTPAAAGLVALMQHRWPASFLVWPEAVRATLMASANIDVHTPVSGKTYSDYFEPDERDGAGVPNTSRIESMMSNMRVRTHVIHRTTSFDSNGEMLLMRVYLTAGQRLRL